MTSLPLAPDRAVVSNRISMLLANRASLLKSLTPTNAPRDKDPPRDNDDDDWLNGAGRPNEGVGYVAAASETVAGGISGRAGRMLGKGKRKADDRRRTRAESEDDDDEGRSGVGRRKRHRIQDDDDKRDDAQKDVKQDGLDSPLGSSDHAATNTTERKKKNKNKKKKKKT